MFWAICGLMEMHPVVTLWPLVETFAQISESILRRFSRALTHIDTSCNLPPTRRPVRPCFYGDASLQQPDPLLHYDHGRSLTSGYPAKCQFSPTRQESDVCNHPRVNENACWQYIYSSFFCTTWPQRCLSELKPSPHNAAAKLPGKSEDIFLVRLFTGWASQSHVAGIRTHAQGR